MLPILKVCKQHADAITSGHCDGKLTFKLFVV